jgi:hypothetical protein
LALPMPVREAMTLGGFDKEAAALVRRMASRGWCGRITRQGHWLGRSPDGTVTVTVSPKNGSPRNLKNAEAVFRRWIREAERNEI